jgi:hypothetical protein
MVDISRHDVSLDDSSFCTCCADVADRRILSRLETTASSKKLCTCVYLCCFRPSIPHGSCHPGRTNMMRGKEVTSLVRSASFRTDVTYRGSHSLAARLTIGPAARKLRSDVMVPVKCHKRSMLVGRGVFPARFRPSDTPDSAGVIPCLTSREST